MKLKYVGNPPLPIFAFTKALVVLASIVSVLALGPPAQAGSYGIRSDNALCLGDLRKWKKYKGWKAMAITRTVGIAQGCGTVGGFASRSEAISQALKACNVNVKYPIFQGNTACRIIVLQK